MLELNQHIEYIIYKFGNMGISYSLYRHNIDIYYNFHNFFLILHGNLCEVIILVILLKTFYIFIIYLLSLMIIWVFLCIERNLLSLIHIYISHLLIILFLIYVRLCVYLLLLLLISISQ
jgi:hypothetical protein